MADAGARGPELALALLRADQMARWRSGDHTPAERYLEDSPIVGSDPELVLVFVYGEYMLRRDLGEAPTLAEYAARFPQFAERLRLQDELHRAMELDGSIAPDDLMMSAPRRGNRRGDGPTSEPWPVVPGYEIEAELGRGGMGVVYRAWQTGLNRQVALKMIVSGDLADSESLRRFRVEAGAVARLQHPHIVQIHEIGERGGRPFFSMEYLEGGSLAQTLDGTPRPPRAAVCLVRQVAEAVHYAHSHGIIHRDLKPGNILFASDQTPKITDFGLAKRLGVEREQSVSGTILGTPCYMAPEQSDGRAKDVGPAADVYALGSVFYELLTGRPPFKAATVLETLELVRSAEPVSPRQLQPKLPRDLETIGLKCLEKDPARRYASAAALAQDLARWLAGEPIAARPLGRFERLWRWARRYKAVAGLSSAVALILVAATVSSTLAVFRFDRLARNERRTASLAAAARSDADARAEENRLLLVRQYVDAGARRMDEGDLLGSLPWLVEALRRDHDDPIRAADHRIRIAAVLRACPKLVQVLPHDGIFSAAYDAQGRWIVTAGNDGKARVWNAASGAQLATIMHGGKVRHASFRPDGRRIVTAGEDGTARVWDTVAAAPALPPFQHDGPVTLAAYSPDGRFIATACQDGTAHVWDAETARVCRRLGPHAGAVRQVAYSPDGRFIVTGDDRAAQVWDADSGAPRVRLEVGRPVWRIVFSPDGRQLVAASTANRTRVWDVATGKPLLTLGHDASVWHAAFSPDGRRIATASFDGTARVWDAASGISVTPPLIHGGIALHAAYSPDGRQLATASDDNTVRVWDAATGARRATLGHSGPVQVAAFHRDGRRILTASDDGAARVWDLAVPGPRTILRHGGAVNYVSFSPDGRQMATGSHDGTARVWDAETGTPRARLDHDAAVWSAIYSPDGRCIVTASADKTARVWDTATGAPCATMAHAAMVWHAIYSADGRRIVTASGNAPMHDMAVTDRVMEVMNQPAYRSTGEARVWDAATGTPLTPPLAHARIVSHAVFSPDGRHVVTSCGDGAARVWDAAAGFLERTLPHSGPVLHAEYSPDGRLIVTAGYDKVARIWNAATGAAHASLPHGRALPYAAFGPDGRRILTASDDGTARVWDAETGAPLTPPMAHKLPLFHAAFSRDGRRVLTASDDGTARVWDAETGAPLSPRLDHDKKVLHAAFRCDGRRIATGCADGTVHFWDLGPDPRPLEDLILLARVLAGSEFHTAGGLMPVPSAQLLEDWRVLQTRYPRPTEPQ